MNPKTERNELIVKLVDKGISYSEIAKQMNLRAKSTVHEIYHRHKFGVKKWAKKTE